MSTKHPMTIDGHRNMQEELRRLKGPERTKISQAIGFARELGDLSENAEYAEAREEQAFVETRIFDLEELLLKAVVIEESKGGTVEIGSVVTVKKGNDTFHYVIVGSYEAKPEEGKISDESPLGRAFVHKKAGDKITIKTPGGSVVYEILETS